MKASLSLLGSSRTLGGEVSGELHLKHTGGGFAFYSTVWLPYFLDNKLEVAHIPFLFCPRRLRPFGLGGTQWTPLLSHQGRWHMVGLRRRLRAGRVLSTATGGTRELQPVVVGLHTTWRCWGVTNDNWHGQWLQRLDLLDTNILVDNPSLRQAGEELYHEWQLATGHSFPPPDGHNSWWDAAGPLAEHVQ